ncbi:MULTISPECIES: anthranilate synthase component I family protein [unclassified Cryobacterium]|uniref:anthranilate synthase component I family protein n=1 Tax=unclassified Cryobacterium TaxID=2649013 RepID=UPI001F542C47|nr:MULTISPECIES: anthranilate synthase component I family protein [unclassified Cryobacterium]
MPSTPSLPQPDVTQRPAPMLPDPVFSRRLPHWIDPAAAFDLLHREASHAVWLDAGTGATAGVSYLAGAHDGSRFVTASARTGTVTCSRPLDAATEARTTAGTIFDFLRADLNTVRATSADGTSPDEVGFRLGWMGWFGYGLAATAAGLRAGEQAGDAPDAALLYVDRVIAFDHAARTVTLLASSGPDLSPAAIEEWALHISRDLSSRNLSSRDVSSRLPDSAPQDTPARPLLHLASATAVDVRWRHDAGEYARLIEACQDRIEAGDAYQLCLTNEVTIAGSFDPVTVYRQLRAGSPSHHGGLLRFGSHALLSASPEEFLSVTPRGRVQTRPIKGTRPRSPDPVTDRMLATELLASDKERAENLMIVDLMRNDLGRVAALGTVAVTSLLQVESYPHVHQLVSTVVAQLAPGMTAVDAIEATFPAGSMTGAPKASAMSILAALEGGDRGIYAGAFGYLGNDGAVDLAMVIRSIVLGPAGASIGTGGGITALSVPAEEIEETRIKARALIGAILASAAAPDPADGQGLVT